MICPVGKVPFAEINFGDYAVYQGLLTVPSQIEYNLRGWRSP